MWSFEREQLESPNAVNPKAVPLSKSATSTTQDVGGMPSTSTVAKDTRGISTTSNTTVQDMGCMLSHSPILDLL